MKEAFATFYQKVLGIYDSNYSLIFDHLKNNGEYNDFGYLLIAIPFFVTLIFYFFYKNPYAKWWQWLITILISAVIVWIATREVAYLAIFETSNNALNQAINDPDSGFESFARPLHFKYAHYNAFISLLVGFITSMIWRPFSKVQKHLPF